MAVRCTLINTSLWPTDGSGTSCSQIPGSACALTSAFIDSLSVNDVEIASRQIERVNDLIELPTRMCSAHLGANSCFSMRDDRKGEGDDIDALSLDPLRQAHRQRCVA